MNDVMMMPASLAGTYTVSDLHCSVFMILFILSLLLREASRNPQKRCSLFLFLVERTVFNRVIFVPRFACTQHACGHHKGGASSRYAAHRILV